MHTCLRLIICLLMSSAAAGTGDSPPMRSAQLDSLASDISMLGYIPSGGEFLVLAASNGWFGLVSEVRLMPLEDPASDRSTVEIGPDQAFYGAAFWGEGGDLVLVTAPSQSCYPEGVPQRVEPGDAFTLAIHGYDGLTKPNMALGTPDLGIVDLEPDSAGSISLALPDRGVYWVEVMQHTITGPSVELLFPVISGGDASDVFSGRMAVPSSQAGSPGEVFEEMNGLRTSRSLEELERDPLLDSIASVRAGNLALSGTLNHIDTETGSLDQLLPESTGTFGENIGRGKGYREAWSMIMISPFHLRTCLSPDYTRTGIAGAVESDQYLWQLVLVQVFTDEREDRCLH